PAIFAQVSGDAVGAGLLADERALDRVGARAAPRLANRRDMIDVDVQPLPLHAADLAVGAACPRPMLLRWKPVVYVAATPRSRIRGRREETNRRSCPTRTRRRLPFVGAAVCSRAGVRAVARAVGECHRRSRSDI